MTFINNRVAAKVFVEIFILSSVIACNGQTKSSNVSTVFKCIQQAPKIWATLAQRNNTIYNVPILTWQTVDFGEKWTPEKRCYHVSEKLTTAVRNNGGKLTGLRLTYGVVKNHTVVCVVDGNQLNCSPENQLFTLNRENEKNPSLILAKIADFAKARGTDSTISENGNTTQFISLDVLVNRAVDLDNGL